jgi:hypothetical protein
VIQVFKDKMIMIMNYYEKWVDDLGDGNFGEDLVCEFLEGLGYTILERRDDYWWDIKAKNRKGEIQTLEVKTDRWEKFNRITNNMVIEVSHKGKPSGIMATKADYYIYFFPEWELIYIIKSEYLRELLNTRPDLFRRKDNVGDNGRVVAYLCNRQNMEQFFKVLRIKKSNKWNERDRQKRI